MVYGGEPQSRQLRAGDTRQGGPGYIHRVSHDERPAGRDGARLLAAPRLGRSVPAGRGRCRAAGGTARPQRAHGAARRRRRARARARALLSGTRPTTDPQDELFDVLDENGCPTGARKARGAVHRDGDWHGALHIWVGGIATGGRPFALFQRRSRSKDTWPGALDVAVGGHLRAGETLADAIREAEEEIGLVVAMEDCRHARCRCTARRGGRRCGHRRRRVREPRGLRGSATRRQELLDRRTRAHRAHVARRPRRGDARRRAAPSRPHGRLCVRGTRGGLRADFDQECPPGGPFLADWQQVTARPARGAPCCRATDQQCHRRGGRGRSTPRRGRAATPCTLSRRRPVAGPPPHLSLPCSAQAESVLSRKPPWCSYDAVTTASASRWARSPRPAVGAAAIGEWSSTRMPCTPSGESGIPPGSQAAQAPPPAAGRKRDERVVRAALDARLEVRHVAGDPQQLQLEREHDRVERGARAGPRRDVVERVEEPGQRGEGLLVRLLLGEEPQHRLEPDHADLEPVGLGADRGRASGRATRR